MTQEAFSLVFQPVVHMRSGRTVGWEALARFDDGEPVSVIRDAWQDSSGAALEQSIIAEAVRQAPPLLDDGQYLAINMTADAVADNALRRSNGFDPERLVVEVTEHSRPDLLANFRALRSFLQRGGRLALDDVGAGYSGLAHIAEANPDIIKVDRGLVRHVNENASKRAVLTGLVAMARTLRCTVVAEGVERSAERDWLLAAGIVYGQGWLFGKPKPVAEWIADGS